MSRIITCALIIGFAASSLFAEKGRDSAKGKDGVDDHMGAIWEFTLTKGTEKSSGKFRVLNHEIFHQNKKVGKAEGKDDDETTITITEWDEMNGTATLRKHKRHPPGATGTLKKKDGSEWEMKVTWKDG